MTCPPKDAEGFMRWLEKKKACEEARAWAQGKDLLAFWKTCECGDWLIWLLSRCDYEWRTDTEASEYHCVMAPVLAEYHRVTDAAWSDYKHTTDAAWSERVANEAVVECDRVTDMALRRYQRAMALAIRRIVGNPFQEDK